MKFVLICLGLLLPLYSAQGETLSESLYCMAQAVYFEAGNQSEEGKRAVAHVILNRTRDSRFPNSVCAVIHEDCQFSWWCDGKSDEMTDMIIKQSSYAAAFAVLIFHDPDFTNNSLFFQHYRIRSWSERLRLTIRVEDHKFYTL